MKRQPADLDWRDARHWGGGRTQPCRVCWRPAFLRDAHGDPCHKACAEQAAVPQCNTANPDPTRDAIAEQEQPTSEGGTLMSSLLATPDPPDREHQPGTTGEPDRHIAAAHTPTSLLTSALAAAARGWHVFPLVPNGKRPAVKDWQTRATTDRQRIERCWTPGTTAGGGWNHARWNVGIACGPSGLVVLDLDAASPGDTVPDHYEQSAIRNGMHVLADLEGVHGDLPTTYTVATPNGGEHRYFTAPTASPAEVRDTNHGNLAIGNAKLDWKIDVRGRGGLIAAAGSIINGRIYSVIDPIAGHLTTPTPEHVGPAVADLPDWIVDHLAARANGDVGLGETTRDTRGQSIPVGVDERSRYVAAAVRGELRRVLSAKNLNARNLGPTDKGPGRNGDLFQAACQLGELVATGDLDRGVVFAGLAAAAEAIGLTRAEAEPTIASGLRKGGTNRRPTEADAPATTREEERSRAA